MPFIRNQQDLWINDSQAKFLVKFCIFWHVGYTHFARYKSPLTLYVDGQALGSVG